MKISKLIKKLEDIQEDFGNVRVVLSKDSEGNGFGSIELDSFHVDSDSDTLIIYPFLETDGINDLMKP